MWELLLAPIDPAREHMVGDAVAWHGRMMVAAWGFALPLGVLIARFFKITPGQDWPRQVDNRFWWASHLRLQYAGGALMLVGLALALWSGGGGGDHGTLGWVVAGFAALQFLAGWLRGTKGGPGDVAMAGDHYDMTPRRLAFEYFHKYVGYALLLLAASTVVTGMWRANAPVWMWAGLALWWTALVATFAALQARGWAVDTYQALWGPDPRHPGNARQPTFPGVRRPGDALSTEARSDRQQAP